MDEQLKTMNLLETKKMIQDQRRNDYIKNNKNKIINENNVYFKKVRKKNKFILSEDFSKSLIRDIHTKWCHMGITQMIIKISPFYTAKNLVKNIKLICEINGTCIKNKS